MIALELAKVDATGQAELVRKGEVTPLEMVDAAIERIEALNPRINAVITPLFEKARAQAQSPNLPDAPFKGIPLLLKDFLCETEGDPYYAGMRFLRDIGWRSQQDTYLAARFRQAGFIFLGKTNLPELAGSATTEPEAFGATHNPWDLSRSAGGSSGGSAAAVASGMVAIAHGNDGTGSIRIPAACCGLVGLKPSRGRISLGPARYAGLHGNIVEFVLTKSVRDAAAVLDFVAGGAPGDLFYAPKPTSRYADLMHIAPKRLRIGLLTRDIFLQQTVHPDCVTAVEQTGKLLEQMGHSVEFAHPPALEGPTGLGLALRMISSSRFAAVLDRWSEYAGKTIQQGDVEMTTWDYAQEGRTYSAVQIHAAYERLLAGVCRTPEWWSSGFDLLVTPTMNQPTPPLGVKGKALGEVFGLFAMPFSISGQPAISLPLHWTADNLPVGVHLVADFGREDLLLGLAAQLEIIQPWMPRHHELLDRL